MAAEPGQQRRLVLVTGLSGAGRSTALKALEDEGYEAIDNLPPALLDHLLADPEVTTPLLAVAVDVRTRRFDADAFLAETRRLRGRENLEVVLVFLTSDTDVLERRFTETRRRHPLAVDRPVEEGIALERRVMDVLREDADLVVDTTTMSGGDLRRHIRGALAGATGPRLSVFVTSFSYRQGLPRNADLVFDVRFLDNPHYVEALRPLSGRDEAVAGHIRKDPDFAPFMERMEALLALLLPGYEREGKHYLTIAVGCTGGRHRSVFVAEQLAALISGGCRRVSVQHRDLPNQGH